MKTRPVRVRPVWLAGRGRRSLSAALVLVLGGCAWPLRGPGGTAPEPPPPTPYQTGVLLLETGAFAGADAELRAAAAHCESGPEGRRALLLLAGLHLDRRFDSAHPDTAAFFAAHFLGLPGAPVEERLTARALYLYALELGADPRPAPLTHPSLHGVAARFEDCDLAAPAPERELPTLDREPLAQRVRRLEAERDSLSTRATQLGENRTTLERRVQELEAQLRAAEAELQRIRRLLGGPGGERPREPDGPP